MESKSDSPQDDISGGVPGLSWFLSRALVPFPYDNWNRSSSEMARTPLATPVFASPFVSKV
jgi:hypothetical protein